MSPATVFKYLERALQEGLGRRDFGSAARKQAREFFGEPLVCVYCGSPEWKRWDHLVPAMSGGEAVLGNIVPACQPCDDSKGRKPFESWLPVRASALGPARVSEVPGRIKRLHEYRERFDYEHTTRESALSAERLSELEDLRRRASELQRDVEAFLKVAGPARSRSSRSDNPGESVTSDEKRLARNAAMRKWRSENREHHSQYMKDWHAKRKQTGESA